MRQGLISLVLVAVATAGLVPQAGAAGPKTKIKECKCSINTPKNWYVLEYYATPAGIEYLVTASPFEKPGEQSIPGVQFLRQKLDAGVTATAEEFLLAVTAEMQSTGKVTAPAPGKLGGQPGATMEAVWGEGAKTYTQRYYCTIRGSEAYVVIITWNDPADLPKLEDSAGSVKF